MLNRDHRDLLGNQALDDIDRLLQKLNENETPTPFASTRAFARSLSHPAQSPARRRFPFFGLGLRMGVPTGIAASLALLLLSVNLVFHSPDVLTFPQDTANTAVPATVTMASQPLAPGTPERLDTLHLNLSLTASTVLVNYSVPGRTPASVNNNP